MFGASSELAPNQLARVMEFGFMHSSQSFCIRFVLQSFDKFGGPSLHLLQAFNVLLQIRWPNLDTIF